MRFLDGLRRLLSYPYDREIPDRAPPRPPRPPRPPEGMISVSRTQVIQAECGKHGHEPEVMERPNGAVLVLCVNCGMTLRAVEPPEMKTRCPCGGEIKLEGATIEDSTFLCGSCGKVF